jgi:hypothetical protein
MLNGLLFLNCFDYFLIYLYNNLAKPYSTVCSDPFYGQTSGAYGNLEGSKVGVFLVLHKRPQI